MVGVWRRAAGCGIGLAVLAAAHGRSRPDRRLRRPTPTASPTRRSRPACRITAIRTGVRKRLADHGITYNLIYTNDVLSNLSKAATSAARSTRASLRHQFTVDLDKLVGLKGLTLLHQRLRDLQHRPHPPRLCRRHQHHRRDRGDADGASVRALARAEILRRRRQPAGRPTRRRHRILLQRPEHDVPAERLADDRRAKFAERRPGLSADDAGRAR